MDSAVAGWDGVGVVLAGGMKLGLGTSERVCCCASVRMRGWEERCTLTPSTSRCNMFCTLRSNRDPPPAGKVVLLMTTEDGEWCERRLLRKRVELEDG